MQYESCSFSCDIPKIVANSLKATAIRENVSEPSIPLATLISVVFRYTKCEKIKLNVKTSDSVVPIEIDLTSESTAGDLFKQSHLKLEETLKDSKDSKNTLNNGQSVVIELPGDVMRPVVRFINESADRKEKYERFTLGNTD